MIARVWAAALRGVADLLDPPPKRAAPRTTAARFEGPTMFDLDEGRQQERQNVAISLLDEDVIAYVLIVARRTTAGTANVALEVAADDPIWPSISETAARLVLEGDRVFRGQT